MNRAREAAALRARARLLREEATIDEELADAIDEDGGVVANDTTTPRKPRRRGVPVAKPTGRVKPSEVDLKRADAILDRHYRR